jgi:hypothetical protein
VFLQIIFSNDLFGAAFETGVITVEKIISEEVAKASLIIFFMGKV